MITVSGRKVNVPCEDRFIGFEGDNGVHAVVLKILNTEMSDFDFKIDVLQRDKNIAEPIKEVLSDGVLLSWLIKKEHIQRGGNLSAQVRAFSGDELVWHSDEFCLLAKASINATESFPSPLPNEFEEMEKRITQMKNEVLENKSATEEDRKECTSQKEQAERAAERVEGAAIKTPYIGDNGNWWHIQGGEYVDSGVSAKGDRGDDGYTPKKGIDYLDGYTPQKGTDYFTPAERDEFVTEVTENIMPNLDAKANSNDVYTKAEVDTAIQTAIGDVLGGVS